MIDLDEVVRRALPIGHVSHRKDGPWKKTGPNRWEPVPSRGRDEDGGPTEAGRTTPHQGSSGKSHEWSTPPDAAAAPDGTKAKWSPAEGGVLFHGTSAPQGIEYLHPDKDGVVYLTDDYNEAKGYAEGIHLGGGGNAGPTRVLRIETTPGEMADISDAVNEAIEAGDDDLKPIFDKARASGAKFAYFSHPSNVYDDKDQDVIVALDPGDTLGTATRGWDAKTGKLFWQSVRRSIGGNHMPAVKPGESRSAYVGRCVRYVMDHEGLDQKAAVGKCEGMFDSAHKAMQRRCIKDAMGLMDPDAEASLETIFNEEPGTGYLESNISPPGSLVSVERDKPKGSINVGGFQSPAPGEATEHEKDILAHAYAAARKAGYDKERASKIAWAAVDRYRSGGKKSAAAHVKLSVAIKSMLTSQSVAVDANELYIGTCEEMEHTDDWKTAMKIALDHLREDPHYYAKLRQAGLLGYDTEAPHEFTLRKSDKAKALPFGIVYRDFHEYARTVRKAKDNRWKNPDGTFKNGFDGCVEYAKASIKAGGKGLPEDRAKALCAYIGRRSGKI